MKNLKREMVWRCTRIEHPHIRLDLDTIPDRARQRPHECPRTQSSMPPSKLPQRAPTHHRGQSNDQSNQNPLQLETAGSQPRMRSEKTSECGVCQIVAGETVPHEHRATVSGCYLVRFSYSPTFYRLDLHTHKSSCCTSKSRMKHQTAKNCIENRTSLLSYGHRKCMFVDFLIGYISPPKSCSLLSVQQLIFIFEDVVESLFKPVLS